MFSTLQLIKESIDQFINSTQPPGRISCHSNSDGAPLPRVIICNKLTLSLSRAQAGTLREAPNTIHCAGTCCAGQRQLPVIPDLGVLRKAVHRSGCVLRSDRAGSEHVVCQAPAQQMPHRHTQVNPEPLLQGLPRLGLDLPKL